MCHVPLEGREIDHQDLRSNLSSHPHSVPPHVSWFQTVYNLVLSYKNKNKNKTKTLQLNHVRSDFLWLSLHNASGIHLLVCEAVFFLTVSESILMIIEISFGSVSDPLLNC